MNMKLRNNLVAVLTILLLVLITLFFYFRVTENQVVINKMSGFDEVLPDSERIILDNTEIKHFTYAVRFANKHQGEVDISAPPFMFTLGEKQYYLWVSEKYSLGTLMKLPNTGTIYMIDEARVNNLLNILHKEYENPLIINQ